MKRIITLLVGLLISATSFAVTCTLPSNLVVNGAGVDPSCLIQYLSNPTFPGGIAGTQSFSGNVSISGNLGVTGGVLPGGTSNLAPLRLPNIPLGPVALASIGTNTTDVAGQFWISEVFVPATKTVTKVGFLHGGTATTDNCLVALFDPNGAKLTTSALTGVLLATANVFEEQTLLASQTLPGPAVYYAAVQCNGTAAGAIQTVSAVYNTIRTGTLAGAFGTVPASITPPTTFTTANAPVVYLF